MKLDSDEKLISKIVNNQCNESLKKLVDKHGGMIFNIGKKYCASCNLDLNELNDNKYWIIFNAAKSFNPQKGSKFSTWLGNQIRFFCLNFRNKNSKLVPVDDQYLEFFINDLNKKNQIANQKELVNIIIDLFNEISDPDTKNAIYYRYFYNKERILNYSEIAKILNNVVDFNIFLENDDDKLDIIIKHQNMEPRPLEMGSGAEKTLASIAIRLALLSVTSLPVSDIFIMDEPGTALDETNLQGFVKILDMIKSYFKTVLIISHLDVLKECVDGQIIINKKGDYAFIDN